MGETKLSDLNEDLFNKISLETINKKLDNIDFNELLKAIDPMESVKSRNIIGGPSPDTILVAIENKETKLEKISVKITEFLETIKQVTDKLSTHSF